MRTNPFTKPKPLGALRHTSVMRSTSCCYDSN